MPYSIDYISHHNRYNTRCSILMNLLYVFVSSFLLDNPSSVAIQVNATDSDGTDDNRQITYSIDTLSAIKFTIDKTSGVISLKSNLDREAEDKYIIIVRATDKVHSANMTININVTDVNDEKPTFSQVILIKCVLDLLMIFIFLLF